MTETIFSVEKRDSGEYVVTYNGHDVGLLASHIEPRYPSLDYTIMYGPRISFEIQALEITRTSKPKKTKRSVARSLGLRKPR